MRDRAEDGSAADAVEEDTEVQYRMYKFNDNKSEALQGRFQDMKTARGDYFLQNF